MLVLKRHVGQRVRLKIGGLEVWIEVSQVRGDFCRLVFDAPPEVLVHREELLDRARGRSGPAPAAREGVRGG